MDSTISSLSHRENTEGPLLFCRTLVFTHNRSHMAVGKGMSPSCGNVPVTNVVTGTFFCVYSVLFCNPRVLRCRV